MSQPSGVLIASREYLEPIGGRYAGSEEGMNGSAVIFPITGAGSR